jgi:hypothetical protein
MLPILMVEEVAVVEGGERGGEEDNLVIRVG